MNHKCHENFSQYFKPGWCKYAFSLDFSPLAVNRVCLLNVANKKGYFWDKSWKYLIDHGYFFNLPGYPLQDRQCNRLSLLLSEKEKQNIRIDICRWEWSVSIAWNTLINYPCELSNIITRVLQHLSFICNSFYRQVFTAQDSEQWGSFKWFKNTVNKLIKASCLQSLLWQMDYTMKVLFHILSILRRLVSVWGFSKPTASNELRCLLQAFSDIVILV